MFHLVWSFGDKVDTHTNIYIYTFPHYELDVTKIDPIRHFFSIYLKEGEKKDGKEGRENLWKEERGKEGGKEKSSRKKGGRKRLERKKKEIKKG